MHNREREQEILNIIESSGGFVSTKQLCEMLFASESSVRRDLKRLETQRLVKRSYGGAAPVTNFSNIVTFDKRTKQNAEAKQEIAQKAASLIKDSQIVFLDQSSTAFYLANEIIDKKDVTIVTNNIEIMMLIANSKTKLICSGGYLSEENRNCLIGADAQITFENIFADIAFFSAKAVSEEGIITDCSREEIVVRNAMMKNARKTVFLCDSSKFDCLAAYKQCEICDVNYIVSEQDCAQYFSKNFSNVELL